MKMVIFSSKYFFKETSKDNERLKIYDRFNTGISFLYTVKSDSRKKI